MIFSTLNKIKARNFLQSLNGGIPVPPFRAKIKADKLLPEYIVRGGYDINDLFEKGSTTTYSIDDNDIFSIAVDP